MRLMTADKAKTDGLFCLDMGAIGKAHKLLLDAKVITKPVDLKQAFDSQFINGIPLALRMA